MPSATLSWSTKEDDMNTPIKFRTPPMFRSFDANNNMGSGQRPHGEIKIDSVIKSPAVQMPLMPCDDCALQKPGLILRWCEDCGSAICDACILDRHPRHAICWYQEALRLANRQFDDVVEDTICKLKGVGTDRIRSQLFQREIVTKIHDIKAKVLRREKESGEMSGIVTRHWNELARLAGLQLNAKTICDRRYAATSSVTVAKMLMERQAVIIKQLKGVDHVVSEMLSEFLGRRSDPNFDDTDDEKSAVNV